MRPRSFNEDEVLDRAFELFWRRGVRVTSLAEIARVLGLQRGSLYNAYGSKETLFLAAYARYADNYLSAVDWAMQQDSLRAQLEGYCQVSIANFCAGRPAKSCPTTRGLMEAVTDNREGLGAATQGALSDLVAKVVSRVEQAFKAGAERGEFDGDSALSARQLVATVRGLVVLERCGYAQEELAAIATHTIDRILN